MRQLNEVLENTIDGVEHASYSTSINDGWGHYLRLFSNGFSEEVRTSSFGRSGTLSLKDSDGKLPLGWDGTYARHQEDLLTNESIAANIIQRATAQLKATAVPTGRYNIIIVNRAMGKGTWTSSKTLGGAAIQQGRSLWKDRLNEQVISEKVTIVDEPHINRGLGSAQFDGDGFETKKRALNRERRPANVSHQSLLFEKARLRENGRRHT